MKKIGLGLAATAVLLLVQGCASSPAPPDPEVSHFPVADYPELMVRCMGEAGFEVKIQNGGIIGQGTFEQKGAIDDALKACEQKFGYDSTTHLTDEQLSALYDVEVKTQACLEALGYFVDLPSRQVYIDTYYSEDLILLETQFTQLQPDVGEQSRVFQECPPSSQVYDPYAG